MSDALNAQILAEVSAAGQGYQGRSAPTSAKKPGVITRPESMPLLVIAPEVDFQSSKIVRMYICLFMIAGLRDAAKQNSRKTAICLLVSAYEMIFPNFAATVTGKTSGLEGNFFTVTQKHCNELLAKSTITIPGSKEVKNDKGEIITPEVKDRQVEEESGTLTTPLGIISASVEKSKGMQFDDMRFLLACFVRTLIVRPEQSNYDSFVTSRIDQTFDSQFGLTAAEKTRLKRFAPDLPSLKLVYHAFTEFEGARAQFSEEIFNWMGQAAPNRQMLPIVTIYQMLDGAGWTYMAIIAGLASGFPEAFEFTALRPMWSPTVKALRAYNRLPETDRGYAKVLGRKVTNVPTSNSLGAVIAVGRAILVATNPSLQGYYRNPEHDKTVQNFMDWMIAQGHTSEEMAARMMSSEEK